MENQQYNTNEVYSANFKTGNRTYFINMLEAKNSAKYVKITESRKVGENEYQKNRIMLFQNDLVKLSRVLNQAVSKIKRNEEETSLHQEESLLPNEETTKAEEIKKENSEFPNSGKKWTKEDEEKLEFLFKAGKTVEDLIEIFGRKQKGIETRLVKLGLIEA
ncbi:MAG: DUF3276 family protein [Candidatus Delongbacteria bacterium]|nr:DUF3276 family protein [Candidatus Delongbacteria bacterium]